MSIHLRLLLYSSICVWHLFKLVDVATAEVDDITICHGLNIEDRSWGREWILNRFNDRRPMYCPHASVILDVDESAESISRTEVPVEFTSCCQLKNTDIFTEEVLDTLTVCPENMVVTGFSRTLHNNQMRNLYRCTGIDLQRYMLAPATAGAYWGVGSRMLYSTTTRVKRTDIPKAIRYAVGRQDAWNWDTDGCIGIPFGSLFVGRFGGSCESTRFRELQYNGGPGDPPKGTPVIRLEPCDYIHNPQSMTPSCINRTSS